MLTPGQPLLQDCSDFAQPVYCVLCTATSPHIQASAEATVSVSELHGKLEHELEAIRTEVQRIRDAADVEKQASEA